MNSMGLQSKHSGLHVSDKFVTNGVIAPWNRQTENLFNGNNVDGGSILKYLLEGGVIAAGTVSFKCERKAYLWDLILPLVRCMCDCVECRKITTEADNRTTWKFWWPEATLLCSLRKTELNAG